MSDNPIIHDRLSWRYWINGDGQWLNRFDCTSDQLLCAITILTVTIMFLSYLCYAHRSHLALQWVTESRFRSHLISIRNVFLVCGLIHFVNGVLMWFAPIYYLIPVLYFINTVQMARLLVHKQQILAIHRHMDGEQAIQKVNNALVAIHDFNLNSVKNSLDRLEQILSNSNERK